MLRQRFHMGRDPSLHVDMALWPPACFADLPVEMVQWVSDRIKHKQDLLSFCRVCWSLRNIGLRTLLNRMRSIYIEPTAPSIAKFRTIVANPTAASCIQTIIYLQTVPLFDPWSLLLTDFDAEAARYGCWPSDRIQVVLRLQHRSTSCSMQVLEQCLVEAVERLPKLQHVVIAANPAAVESDTSGHYSGDILNADSQWIASLKEPHGDSALVNRTGARASAADSLFNYVLWADDSRFFWGLAPLLVAMAQHADSQPEALLNFTFQGRVPVGTGELLEFATSQSATFDKAMGHIKNFHVRATSSDQRIHDEPGVVNSEAYEKMLSKLENNVQGLVFLTNRGAAQQADVLSVLLRHPTLHLRRLQVVQFLSNVAIFDPAIEWMQQQWVPLLHTGNQLFRFLCRHRTTLKYLALHCVSGVHRISPQGGLEIETLQDLVLALRMPKKFGRLQELSIHEIVTFGDRPDDIGLPRAQVLNLQARREASSRLGELARELHAVREGYVCSTMSDGLIALHEYIGPSSGTSAATHVDNGASAAAQPGQKDNTDTKTDQTADPAEADSTAVETVSPQDPNNDGGTGDSAEDATATVVPETASAIESKPDTSEKEQLSQTDNADTAAAEAAASDQAGIDDVAEEEVSTRDSENDNGPEGNAGSTTPPVVPETAAAIDGNPEASEKKPLFRQDDADTAAAQPAASERAGVDATAGEEASTRNSSDDNGTGKDASPAAVSQHLIFGYEFRLEEVKHDGKEEPHSLKLAFEE